jgi:hypothetical protein
MTLIGFYGAQSIGKSQAVYQILNDSSRITNPTILFEAFRMNRNFTIYDFSGDPQYTSACYQHFSKMDVMVLLFNADVNSVSFLKEPLKFIKSVNRLYGSKISVHLLAVNTDHIPMDIIVEFQIPLLHIHLNVVNLCRTLNIEQKIENDLHQSLLYYLEEEETQNEESTCHCRIA